MVKKVLLLVVLLAGFFAQAQIVNIPDANFKAALLSIGASDSSWNYSPVDINGDGEIQQTEALTFSYIGIPCAGIVDFTGLEAFQNLRQISFQELQSTTNLDLSSYTQLRELSFSGSNIPVMDLSQCNSLELVSLANDTFGSLLLPENGILRSISILSANLQSLDLSNIPTLQDVLLGQLGNVSSIVLNVDELNNFNSLGAQIENLVINAASIHNLTISDIAHVEIHSPIFHNDIDLGGVIDSIDLSGSGFTGHNVAINTNDNANINLSGCHDISSLTINGWLMSFPANFTTTINLEGIYDIQQLIIANSADLVIPSSNTLNALHVVGATNLTLGDLPELTAFHYYHGDIPSINLSQMENLETVYVNNANIGHLNLKNGSNENLENNGFVESICVDDDQLEEFLINYQTHPEVQINTYCTSQPGGNFNRFKGVSVFDAASDGCGNDQPWSFLKMSMTDGTQTTYDFTDADGEYRFYPAAGDYTVSPQLEIPAYFTVTPASANANFAAVDGTIATHNFCISSNGVNPDVEIVVSPTNMAFPGFDIFYQITVRNKGNQTISSSPGIVFNFDTNQLDYVSSVPTADTSSSGSVTWNYAALAPFETRVYNVTLNVHPPTHASPVNMGDIVSVQASVTAAGDVMPGDNTFSVSTTAVNSFDPNDITCLEGDMEHTSKIGDYLHYRVRFENTGTAAAQNIVVRMPIDEAMYQVNSLQMLHASHDLEVRIQDNIAEFFFMGIQLETEGHGQLLFKLKTLASLQNGDSVTSAAGIYFDYNFPILTNEAETVFSDLSVSDNRQLDVSVYPNPAQNKLSIASLDLVSKAETYDTLGRLIELHQLGGKRELDVSGLASGTYFLKLYTTSGSRTVKFIKK